MFGSVPGAFDRGIHSRGCVRITGRQVQSMAVLAGILDSTWFTP